MYRLCFFFNDTATTEIYTLSLHDALPIWSKRPRSARSSRPRASVGCFPARAPTLASRSSGPASPASSAERLGQALRSEEHTSELQSRQYLVCRLLLEKKNPKHPVDTTSLH